MLKVTYAETGLYLEYCPVPLEGMLSDRVCLCARAQRPITIQPMQASIPLLRCLVQRQNLSQNLRGFPELQLSLCDQDWVEITLSGLWITEEPTQEEGVFVTELMPLLEQRLFHIWSLAQTVQSAAIANHLP